MDTQVILSLFRDIKSLNRLSEEFNKYLTYVRNLGFEDTPDYDYLRDLFTQALKNTGEVEDGEYDWMKLNNGRGWEYKSYSSQHHSHANNQVPNSSARELHGVPARPSARPGITADRLNAAQPPPPSPAKPGAGKTRDRPSASGVPQPKRQSGAAGGLETATPTASTQAQFQNSNAHLPGRLASPGNQAATNHQQASGLQGANEPQPSFFQKAMRALCCGTGRKS
jgi:casein kinase 1